MIGKLLGKEETNAALVFALSGALTLLVASGPGSVSLGRVVGGALSNPIRGAAGTRRSSTLPAPSRHQQVAA